MRLGVMGEVWSWSWIWSSTSRADAMRLDCFPLPARSSTCLHSTRAGLAGALGWGGWEVPSGGGVRFAYVKPYPCCQPSMLLTSHQGQPICQPRMRW